MVVVVGRMMQQLCMRLILQTVCRCRRWLLLLLLLELHNIVADNWVVTVEAGAVGAIAVERRWIVVVVVRMVLVLLMAVVMQNVWCGR